MIGNILIILFINSTLGIVVWYTIRRIRGERAMRTKYCTVPILVATGMAGITIAGIIGLVLYCVDKRDGRKYL